MEIFATFLAVLSVHLVVTALDIRLGLILAIFLYGLYPKFLSLGLSSEGFALSGQRAMLYMLTGFYILHALWGSSDVRRGLLILDRYRWIIVLTAVYLGARLVGNLVSGRLDIGSIAALVNQSMVSILILILLVTYVKSKADVIVVLTAVILSLAINQFAALTEFFIGHSLFPENLDLQYQTTEDSRTLEGSSRAGSYRSRGLFDNPLKLTGFICLAFPMSVALLKTSGTYLHKVLLSAVIFFVPVVAVLTGSRTAIVVMAFIVSMYLYTAMSRGMSRIGKRALLVAGIGLAVSALYLVGGGLLETAFLGSDYARSSESRVLQFVRVPIALSESPFFGFGFARNIIDLVDAGHVDSFFLQTALEGGLVAVVALIFVLVLALNLLRKVSGSSTDSELRILATNLSIAIGAAFVLSLVLSMSVIRFYIFLLVGLSIVLHYLHTESMSKP